MKRKILVLAMTVLLVVSALVLSSCYKEIDSDDSEKHRDTQQIFVYVDKDTGVNYLMWNKGYGAAMTVRLNADGSLRVSEVD